MALFFGGWRAVELARLDRRPHSGKGAAGGTAGCGPLRIDMKGTSPFVGRKGDEQTFISS